MGYRFIKLSCDITKSTIWTEDDSTFRIWIWMMAEADRDGVVQATIPGIALGCRKTITEVETALEKFEQPDPYSSNPANEGRRIAKIARGWRLLNYTDHRDRRGGDENWQKERHRKNQQAYRDRRTVTVTDNVTGTRSLNGHKPVTVTIEAEAEVRTVSNASHSHPATGGVKPSAEEAIYQEYPRKVAKKAAIPAIRKAIKQIQAGVDCLAIPDKREAQKYLYKRVQAFARSPEGTRPDTEYLPHPATWFNKGRYLDDDHEWELTDPHEKPQPQLQFLPKPGGG